MGWFILVIILIVIIGAVGSNDKKQSVAELRKESTAGPSYTHPSDSMSSQIETVNDKPYTFKILHNYVGYFDDTNLYFFQDISGVRSWFKICQDNKAYLHRFDGPAVEHLDGYAEWWVLGLRKSKKTFKQIQLEHSLDQ